MSEGAHRHLRRQIVREIGELLRAARVARGLSQEEVAEAANLATFTYASLERGHTLPGIDINPTLDTLIRAATVLEVDLRDLPDL